MEAIQIKIDGQDILRDGVSGIYYTQKNWRQLVTSDNASDRQGWHGRNVSATFARVRVITLEGHIDRQTNPANEQDVVEFMEGLFPLQVNPSVLVPRTLYVKDVYNREWSLSVKVKEPLDIYEGDSNFKGSHWSWRVVLESVGDPTYTTPSDLIVSGVEGAYGGFTLGKAFPFAMSNILNNVSVTNTGNGSSFPRIELVVSPGGSINSPLRVRNITTGDVFGLDVNGTAGDIIIIDSMKMECYKNGDDITASRTVGSIWPEIIGTTEFFIEDADGGVMGSDFSVTFYYKNSLL